MIKVTTRGKFIPMLEEHQFVDSISPHSVRLDGRHIFVSQEVDDDIGRGIHSIRHQKDLTCKESVLELLNMKVLYVVDRFLH